MSLRQQGGTWSFDGEEWFPFPLQRKTGSNGRFCVSCTHSSVCAYTHTYSTRTHTHKLDGSLNVSVAVEVSRKGCLEWVVRGGKLH